MKYFEVESQIKARCGAHTNQPVARGGEDTEGTPLSSKPGPSGGMP